MNRTLRAQSFKLDADRMAKQGKVLEGKVEVYTPTPAKLDRWYAGAPAAWVAVKGTYDRALARRVLEEQGQTDLIKKLEAAKAP